jgi:hypothetical protein
MQSENWSIGRSDNFTLLIADQIAMLTFRFREESVILPCNVSQNGISETIDPSHTSMRYLVSEQLDGNIERGQITTQDDGGVNGPTLKRLFESSAKICNIPMVHR